MGTWIPFGQTAPWYQPACLLHRVQTQCSFLRISYVAKLFSQSPNEGLLRPHIAPESIVPGRGTCRYTSKGKPADGRGYPSARIYGGGINPWRRNSAGRTNTLQQQHNDRSFSISSASSAIRKRHDFLRRSSPSRVRPPSTKTMPRWSSSSVLEPNGGFYPRTQILGMNGRKLPKEVRQAPADRQLNVACGIVGHWRVYRTVEGRVAAGSSRPR